MYIEVYCCILIDCGAKAVLKVCDNLGGGSFLNCPLLVPLQYKVNGYELSLDKNKTSGLQVDFCSFKE